MQSFELKLFIDNFEQNLEIQPDRAPGNYIINQQKKFIARIFKDGDGKWKSVAISDLSPSVIEAIGIEIDKKENNI